ncbi:uncharacterized protein LOC122141566 [Cyprinus carpio]|uniref:Uncharacterized protein LOC122141566 n=1 Tax=Cyprinus carpio TaxID=7962 RepID=A0A9Q9XNZ5_CYPCA|nr:uncharacterized protein LOC122141566 [Cyprinus carpio]
METFVLFLVTLLVDGVFGYTDEVKSVSVMEGDSVTLYTDLTEIQKADLILWTFGPDSTGIAQINRLVNKISYYDVFGGRFRDRLKLDHQTGSLTITNTTEEHAGLFRFLHIIGGKEVLPKKFSVIVSAPDSSACYIELVCLSALAVVAVFFGIFYCCHHRRSKQAANQGPPDGEEHIWLTNGVVNGNTGDTDRPNSAGAETPDQEKHSQNSDFIVKDEIKLMKMMRGQSVTLHTDLTEIEENELIWWKFADSSVNKEAEFSVIAKWDKTNNEENLCNEERFRDRLHLDHNTGSLTITNITNELCGHNKLHITIERLKISKTFSVALYDPKKIPEIQRIGLDNRRVHSF